MLSLIDIHKTYTLGPIDVEVLRGVSMELAGGDFVSIMGPSGSGKSTLMNIMGLLDQPSRGSYLLDGRDMSTISDSELSRLRNAKIGFVFQSFHLLPRMTALENASLPLVYRGLKPREVDRRARRMLDRVDMLDRAEHKPHELSGGQQQRVAIARALIGEPALVLADEPTGALDPDTGAEILQLFQQLNRDDGATLVIITHDHGVARQCQRQMSIANGRLQEAAARAG